MSTPNPDGDRIEAFIREHPNKYSKQEVAKHLYGDNAGSQYNKVAGIIRLRNLRQFVLDGRGSLTKEESPMARKTKAEVTNEARLESQLRTKELQRKETDQKYKALQDEIHKAERARDDALMIMNHKPKIHKMGAHAKKKGSGEGTAIILASDWHAEEHVPSHKVNGLNEYNLEIATRRMKNFFNLTERFVALDRQDMKIDNLLIWLGGDFITGSEMHDAECLLHPAPAIMFVKEMIISGITHLLENDPNLNIHVVGSVGNHSRMSGSAKKVNQATEQERSLEWMMYHSIRDYFKDKPNVTFTLNNSYHSYVDVHGKRIRFNHGHLGWRYNDGLGGIHGPAWKCISQKWDKQIPADLTCFGHYHTYTPAAFGRPYVCNGSLIGLSPYSMQFGNEPPIQAYFVMHSKYGIVSQRPMFIDW